MTENATPAAAAAPPAPDPAEHYAELRAQCPMAWRPNARAWLALDYDVNHAGLRAPDTSHIGIIGPWLALRDRHGHDFNASISVISDMPFNYEGAHHARLRRLAATTVVPFADRREVFEGAARRLIAPGLRHGGLDFAEDFANRLLFEVLCDLAMLSEADKEVLYPLSRMSWTIEATLPIRDRWRMERTVRDGMALLTERAPGLIARHPESLLATLHRAAPADEPDPLAMAISMFGVFLLMGNDALGGSIGQGVDWLLDPQQHRGATVPQREWRHLGDDMFRQTATVDYLTRVFHKGAVIGGVELKPNDKVMFSPLAANRDPKKFGPTADRISLDHAEGVGLTFGAGRHLCVGMSMSRHIIAAALSVLAEAPPLRLAGQPRRAAGNIIRTMASVPVEFA